MAADSLNSDDATLRIRLLGGFGIETASGAEHLVPGKRVQTLIAYLLLHRGTHLDRKHLAFLLWPDSAEQQALTNLRQLIHDVRASLPEPGRFIEAGRQLICWRMDAPFTLDIDEFEVRLAIAMRDPTERGAKALAALSSAVAIYAGDLLPECYDEWIEPERRRLRDALAGALGRLANLLEERREYQAALRQAERLLDLDPLNEGSLLMVMRLCAADGECAKALDTYRRGEERFRRELGVAPGAALREFRGRVEDGLRDFERGPATARDTGRSFWDRELLQLQRELLAAAGGSPSEARRLIGAAMSVATWRGATSQALRAERSPQLL